MTDIEIAVSFVALLGGLLLANVANNLADALRARRDLPIGFTPWAINFYISVAVINIFVLLSAADETFVFDMLSFVGLLVAFIPYIMVSRLLYPEHKDRWASVEDYYIANRKLILGIMLITQVVAIFSLVHGGFYLDLTISGIITRLLGLYGPVILILLLLMLTDKRQWHWAGFGFLIAHRISIMTLIATSVT